MLVRFRPLYATSWDTSPNTLYEFLGESLSHASWWIIMAEGERRCVPAVCLEMVT